MVSKSATASCSTHTGSSLLKAPPYDIEPANNHLFLLTHPTRELMSCHFTSRWSTVV